MKLKGTIVGKTFRRSLLGSKHRMRVIPGWGIDAEILTELFDRGITTVEISDMETNAKYTARLEDFPAHGVLKDFGYNEQSILPDKWWKIEQG